MGPAVGLAGLEHLVQVRGVGGESIDAFVQVAVAGRRGAPGVAGQGGQGVSSRNQRSTSTAWVRQEAARAPTPVPRRSRSATNRSVSSVAVSAGTSSLAE